MIAAWMDYSAVAASFQDPLGGDVAAANRLDGGERTKALLAVIDPVLAADAGVVALLEGLRGTVAGHSAPASA